MTVRELRDLLMTLEDDMTVVFMDTYTRNEGWDSGADKAVLEVEWAEVNDNGECELGGW